MRYLRLLLCIFPTACVCQGTPILQEPLRSGLDVQVGPAFCKLPSADWSVDAVRTPWPPLNDKFVLKLNDTGNTYRLEKLKPGDYKGIVYKVLGNNKDEVIAYAKTPPANDDRNWEQFRNEISATKDVGQAIDFGVQRTEDSDNSDPRPWLIVKPMKGTILSDNALFQAAKKNGNCRSLVQDKLIDRYMLTNNAYINTYGWWHHDTNMANAFWTDGLEVVYFIDWGQARRVPPAPYDEMLWRSNVLEVMRYQCP